MNAQSFIGDMPSLLLRNVERILERSGGLYSIADVLERVQSGDMQSFSINNSWVVTQVIDFPQRKIIDIVFAMGKLAEVESLEAQIIEFGRKHGASLIITNGRKGWHKSANRHGWRDIASVFVKDIVQ